MDISEFNERITIREKQETIQPNGERLSSHVNLASVWSKAIPVSGNEIIQADQKQAVQNYRFIIRYRELNTANNDIYWRGKSWDITFINPYHKEGYRNFIEIKAETTN